MGWTATSRNRFSPRICSGRLTGSASPILPSSLRARLHPRGPGKVPSNERSAIQFLNERKEHGRPVGGRSGMACGPTSRSGRSWLPTICSRLETHQHSLAAAEASAGAARRFADNPCNRLLGLVRGKDLNLRPLGSIKKDVKRKSGPASWKPRKVSASSPSAMPGASRRRRACVVQQ